MIKLLAGAIPLQGRRAQAWATTEAGYFSQQPRRDVPPGHTPVLQEALHQRHQFEQTVRIGARWLLPFRGYRSSGCCGVLKAAVKSRLYFGPAFTRSSQLLLLLTSQRRIRIWQASMFFGGSSKNLEGTICFFISHDVYFVRQLADHASFM